MPTIILLDVSLSMTKPVQLSDGKEVTKKQLAEIGINAFLDHLSVYSKLEFISLMAFSSLYEEKCPFTRDYNLIKEELKNIDEYDKTCIETAFHGVNQMVLAEWGNNIACEIILVTDGSTGVGPMSLKEALSMGNRSKIPFPIPFSFPAKLHIICITTPSDPCYIKSKPLYQRLIDLTGYDGSIMVPDNLQTETTTINLFQKLADEIYTTYKGTLKCGFLNSKIILSPAPLSYTKVGAFDVQTHHLSQLIEVCGFISVSDVGSPMAVSRHLILPASSPAKQESSGGVKMEVDVIDDDVMDEGRTPSFCVLLHGALRVENSAAVVILGRNWFGFIYSWADSKKKSNLMLTILVPGSDAVPWLGDLNNLGCPDMFPPEQVGTFPVRPTEKRSYSQNGVVWIRQAGLQSDIQKILRHARKLPEKTQQFYKELNRLRKAAISLGFLDLLNGLAYIFEQECMQLPGSAHPDCALQLQHAADCLRNTQNRDIKCVIMPLQTNYTSS